MTDKPAAADTAIEKAARAMAPDAWHENGRGGYTLVMADEEQARARKKARAAVIAYLEARLAEDMASFEAAIASGGVPGQISQQYVSPYTIIAAKRHEFAMRSAELSSLKGKVGE